MLTHMHTWEHEHAPIPKCMQTCVDIHVAHLKTNIVVIHLVINSLSDFGFEHTD